MRNLEYPQVNRYPDHGVSGGAEALNQQWSFASHVEGMLGEARANGRLDKAIADGKKWVIIAGQTIHNVDGFQVFSVDRFHAGYRTETNAAIVTCEFGLDRIDLFQGTLRWKDALREEAMTLEDQQKVSERIRSGFKQLYAQEL